MTNNTHKGTSSTRQRQSPSLSVSSAQYRALIHKKLGVGLLLLCASGVLFLLAPTWLSDNASSGSRRTGEWYALLMFFTPLYALNYLLTVKQRVDKQLRAKIALTSPKLQTHKENHLLFTTWQKIVIVALFTIVVVSGLLYYIVSLIKFSQS